MNKNTVIALVVVAALSFLAGRYMATSEPESNSDSQPGEREVLYWVAPMDANYRRDQPGKSPMGMDLKPVYVDEVDSQPGVVKIDPVLVNNLGVKTATAARSTCGCSGGHVRRCHWLLCRRNRCWSGRLRNDVFLGWILLHRCRLKRGSFRIGGC